MYRCFIYISFLYCLSFVILYIFTWYKMIKCRQLMGVEILGYGMAIGLVMRKGDTNNMNVLEKILEEIEERRGFRETLVKYEKKNGTIVDAERNRCALEELDIVERIIRSHMGEVENDNWIRVSERLPEEHDSIFARFKGTDTWNDALFEKTSDEVNVTIEYDDGSRKTTTSYTLDGVWEIEKRQRVAKRKVIAWTPLPEAYKGE